MNELLTTEQILSTKNAELEKINAELDRFVYSASHELRAPLTSVLGLINLAELNLSPDNKLEYLEMMRTSINKLDSFIQDIIRYSKNSRLELENEKINFSSIIYEVLNGLKYLKGWERLRVEHDISGPASFWSDSNRIRMLLNNIISNSIRFFDPTKENPFLNIVVSCNKEEAIIVISDNGKGIPADHVDRIFDMFYRASAESSGTGLGLYIVKEIVTKLHGKISVQSRLGEGSTFTIILPNHPSQFDEAE
jgi:signal transduction histidine kinase